VRILRLITVDRIATAIVVTLSIAITILMVTGVLVMLFAPSALPR